MDRQGPTLQSPTDRQINNLTNKKCPIITPLSRIILKTFHITGLLLIRLQKQTRALKTFILRLRHNKNRLRNKESIHKNLKTIRFHSKR
jgi:hypothetical protein